jgi:hypothetical protein
MSDNISADNTPEIASHLDVEEAFLIQEYKKAKVKLAQIREKKGTGGLGRKERATASSVQRRWIWRGSYCFACSELGG